MQEPIDFESEQFLRELEEKQKVRANKIEGVRTVLVVLSSRMMAFDRAALTQKIQSTYPQAAIFFRSTCGDHIGVPSPDRVDLLLDLSGPKERQGFFFSRKLKRIARVSVGRKKGYDRVFEETEAFYEKDFLSREREAQQGVLALAGIPIFPTGDTHPDRGKLTPLELPPLRKVQ